MVPQPKARQSTWASGAYHSLLHTVLQTPRNCTSTCPSQESRPPVSRQDWCSSGERWGGGRVRSGSFGLKPPPDQTQERKHPTGNQSPDPVCFPSYIGTPPHLGHRLWPALHACYSDCGPRTCGLTMAWNLVRNAASQALPRPTESESIFTKTPTPQSCAQ